MTTSRENSTRGGVEVCPVCLERPTNLAAECSHRLCSACWSAVAQMQYEQRRCPLCRKDLAVWLEPAANTTDSRQDPTAIEDETSSDSASHGAETEGGTEGGTEDE